jgi:hypothetical protein
MALAASRDLKSLARCVMRSLGGNLSLRGAAIRVAGRAYPAPKRLNAD